MAKKRTKKRDTSNTTRELSLLLPSFSYIFDRLDKISADEALGDDAKMAKAISKKMAFIIKRFTIPAQQKALELSNEAMKRASEDFIKDNDVPPELIDEWGGLKVNVFSLGLGLLGTHHEMQNKTIHIGMLSELVDLQDYCEQNIDRAEINRAYKYCDYVYKYTMSLPVG